MQNHNPAGQSLRTRLFSIPGLAFALLVAGIVLCGITWSTRAATIVSDGQINVTALVPGPPPSVPATILVPSSEQRFNDVPITVSGTCPADLIVKIYDNNSPVGATTCSAAGDFSLLIDLFVGQNDLIARVYDAIDQAGPDSNMVRVYLDLPVTPTPTPGPTPAPPSSGTASKPATTIVSAPCVKPIITTDKLVAGNLFTEQELAWTATIACGTPPYALSWDWGDGTVRLYSRPQAGDFTAHHQYRRAGVYKVVLQLTDQAGQKSYRQMVAVVNSTEEPATGSKNTRIPGGFLMIAWPVYVVALLMLISFWLGERREEDKLDPLISKT